MQTLQRTGPLPLHEFREVYLPSLGFKPAGDRLKGGGRWMCRPECVIRLYINIETEEMTLFVRPETWYRRGNHVVRQRVRPQSGITILSPTWEDFFALMSLLGLSHLLDSPEPASTIPPV